MPVGQAVDEVQLPQRPRAIQRPRGDSRDLLADLGVRRGLGQRELAHVVLEVEVRIVDPVGVVEVERDAAQAPAERRQQRQALGHQRLHVLQLEPARRAGRVGSSTIIIDTCPHWLGVSSARNCASRAVSWRMSASLSVG